MNIIFTPRSINDQPFVICTKKVTKERDIMINHYDYKSSTVITLLNHIKGEKKRDVKSVRFIY